MTGLQDLTLIGVPLGAAAFAATVFIWRWSRRNIGLEYGPEVMPSGDIRMRITLYARIPSNRPDNRRGAQAQVPQPTDRDAA